MKRLLSLVATVLFVAAPVFAEARTFALVIGVNNYVHVPRLDGARADAVDISSALDRSGADRVITLLDGDVTKANITASWQELMQSTMPGDLIFLTYAGHGAQIKQLKDGDEGDGLDEFWVLPGFDPQNIAATWKESVFDNEIHDWSLAAGKKGVRVVVVADSCHAGGMNRAVNGKLRFVEFGQKRMLEELWRALSGGSASEEIYPGAPVDTVPDNMTLLAATSEALPVPEVVIDGQSRGALSWSVARAVEGMADADGNGTVTRIELEDYVLATVRMRSEALQTPVFTPVAARSADEVVFSGLAEQGNEVHTAARKAGKTGRNQMASARDLGFEPVLALETRGEKLELPEVTSGAHPYVWDAKSGIFRSPNGDVVAEGVSGFTVGEIVDKFIVLDFLQALASQNPGSSTLTPQKDIYVAGEHIKFDTPRGKYKNMLVFNLANTGEVQLLDLVVEGNPQMHTPLKEVKVIEPFGSDHLVTIASDEPLEAIGKAIQNGSSPKDLLAILQQRLDGREASVSILPLYTRAE